MRKYWENLFGGVWEILLRRWVGLRLGTEGGRGKYIS